MEAGLLVEWDTRQLNKNGPHIIARGGLSTIRGDGTSSPASGLQVLIPTPTPEPTSTPTATPTIVTYRERHAIAKSHCNSDGHRNAYAQRHSSSAATPTPSVTPHPPGPPPPLPPSLRRQQPRRSRQQRHLLLDPEASDRGDRRPDSGIVVSGTVRVRGTAAGSEFQRYVLRYGQAVLTRNLAGHRRRDDTITSGPLGRWRTLESPDGAYMLQLTAYGTSGQERAHVFPLLVDNTAPSVSWVYPVDGAVLDAGPIDLRANARDNLGLTQVDFFVDGQLIGSVNQTSCLWTGRLSQGSTSSEFRPPTRPEVQPSV